MHSGKRNPRAFDRQLRAALTDLQALSTYIRDRGEFAFNSTKRCFHRCVLLAATTPTNRVGVADVGLNTVISLFESQQIVDIDSGDCQDAAG